MVGLANGEFIMIRHLLDRLTAIVAALCLVGGNVAAAADRKNDPVKVCAGGAIRGINQVVIGAFNVSFICQSITDAAHADFVRQLTAAGLTVRDSAAMFLQPGVRQSQASDRAVRGQHRAGNRQQGQRELLQADRAPQHDDAAGRHHAKRPERHGDVDVDRHGRLLAANYAKANNVAAVFGVGGMMFGKSKPFAFTATPGSYEQGVTKAAALANERVVVRMAAVR